MEHLFVPYEIALTLKEKGFKGTTINSMYYHIHYKTLHDYSYFSVFENMLDAPIYQEVIDWFIEKHFIYIHTSLDSYREPYKLVPQIQKMELTRTYVEFEKYYGHFDNTTKGNYEALKKAIEEALKLI